MTTVATQRPETPVETQPQPQPLPQPRTQPPPVLPGVKVSIISMLTLSALAVWLVLFALLFSRLQASRTNAVEYAALRENLSAATAPIGGVIARGTPIALLDAPQASLRNAVIVEGTAPSDLRAGPGHLRSTPLPGQAGVSILFGRSLTFGAPFAHITALRRGDAITVTTGQGRFRYVVDDVRRPGDPTASLLPAGSSRLLLETSAGQLFSDRNTVYVDATIDDVKSVVPTPAGRPTSVPRTELAMSGDTSQLLPLVLWLQLLVLTVLASVWARARWGLWQAWLFGVPLGLAALWGASSTALLLVPNLI